MKKHYPMNNYQSWQRHKVFFCCVFMLIYVAHTHAQAVVDFTFRSFGLENDTANVIQNSIHLDEFYEQLYQLKATGKRKINIVHIGDSHIQGDYLAQPVRKNFQQHFGNAGRGLVVPLRVAGTNEAYNIVSQSETTWKAKRCVHPDNPLPIGIGGVTISTDQSDAEIDIYMRDLWMDYTFNALTLFYYNDTHSFEFVLKDTADNTLASINRDEPNASVNYERVTFKDSVSAITIKTIQTNPDQNHATIFGVSLQNDKDGVLYHSIGVNGAKYKHYHTTFLAEQAKALQPELFIISLGTNEALDFPHIDKNLYQHIDKLVSALRKNNPQTKFLLVTPPPSFRNVDQINPGVLTVRKTILNYAVENGLAFWDMHKVLGGENAAALWRTCGLLRTDGVHFTKDAYEYQGNLFFYALLKGYNQYVRQHRY